LAVYAISPPRFEKGWWCIPLSNGTGVGFETRAAAMKFYRENQKGARS
jgi:hypothetical protein